jgi:putative transposase
LADWSKQRGGCDHEIGERELRTQVSTGNRAGVVERCFGWLTRNRGLAKDSGRKVQTSETLIEVAVVRLLIAPQGACRDVVPTAFRKETVAPGGTACRSGSRWTTSGYRTVTQAVTIA